MGEVYSRFAELYDRLTFDVDYRGAADRICEILKQEQTQPSLVLDLACGTGTLTSLLAGRGYDMIGADASSAMLNIAREKCPNALLLLQDMRDFELYGTVDAIVCMLDSFNYLTGDGELDAVLHLCNNYLNPNGLLLFDVNSEYKFRHVLADQTYSFETNGIFYVWENEYDADARLCDFYLTFFQETEGGLYERFDERHTERCYSCCEIEHALARQGFSVEGCFDGYTRTPAHEESERIFYVCRNVRPIQRAEKQDA